MARMERGVNNYRLADRWYTECLSKDGSILTDGAAIWTDENLEAFEKAFIDNPREGEGDWISDKLKDQLGGQPAGVVQLAAEMVLLMLAPLGNRTMTHQVKTNRVMEILGWIEPEPRIDHPVSDWMSHLANTGTYFITNLWRALVVTYRWSRLIRDMDSESRVALRTDPSALDAFMSEQDPFKIEGQHWMLAHLLQPEAFEPIYSRSHKEKVVAAFADKIPAGVQGLDQQIRAIREALEPEFGAGFDFYADAIKPRWLQEDAKPGTATSGTAAKPKVVDDDALNRVLAELERKKQVILYGPPGTGKTRLSLLIKEHYDDGGQPPNVEAVTFHPAFSYEDFVEGLRPTESGMPPLALEDGIFKRLCEAAARDPERTFLLVIDEINRSNLASVFGELITLIEADKRFDGTNGVEATLPYSKKLLGVPSNLHILGTMNTADRSIRLMDAALRRRFAFVELLPDATLLGDASVGPLALARFLKWINAFLLEEDRERQVGHAYLMDRGAPIGDLESFRRVFEFDLLPLLQEYSWDDYAKLERMLGSDVIDIDRQVANREVLADANLLAQALATHMAGDTSALAENPGDDED